MRIALICVLIVLCACAPAKPCDHPVKTSGEPVVCVIDGDTIRLSSGQSVRFIGMDTPERGQDGYGEATNETITLIDGSEVRFEKDVSETDKYSRLLRFIYANDVFVNEYLVERGYARAMDVPPDTNRSAVFHAAEKKAREAKAGLWQ